MPDANEFYNYGNKSAVQFHTLKDLYIYLQIKNPDLTNLGFDGFSKDMQDENNFKQLYTGLASKYPRIRACGYDTFKNMMLPLEQQKSKIGSNPTINNTTQKSSTSFSHTNKIKIGDTYFDLPIPRGFVRIDESMPILNEFAHKLCPKTNTLLSYYISEEDFANYQVNQDHAIEKYILVEIFNEMKNAQVGNRDYREFKNKFKNEYLNKFKKDLDRLTPEIEKNYSEVIDKFKFGNFNMQPFGVCYESKSTISYGIFTKYDFTYENGSSTNNVLVAVSTLTKIGRKPVFLFIYKKYTKSDDLNAVKTINSDWVKEIEKDQGTFSFLSDFDFEYYKEIILAILTLSFIWASYFVTKKIRRTITAREKTIEPIKDESNNFVDFEELLADTRVTAENEMQKPSLDVKHIDDPAPIVLPSINQEWHKASRTIRLFNFIIDMLLFYVGLSYGFGYALGYYGFGNYVIEHPYLFNIIILFVPYFLMEYIFGKTVGKFITRTHVVNSSGGKPTIWQFLGRTASRLIPFESLSFLFKGKRGLHDTLSETYVIYDKI